ncbi:MAG TPA: hypothetical protein V6C58_08480, partial [Allocoleopsis sp.]
VELTRKRQGKNVYEIFGGVCPSCGGLGHIVQLPGEVAPVAVEQLIDPVVSPPVKSAYPIEMPDTLGGNAGYREKPVIHEVWEAENLEEEEEENVDFNPGYQERLRSKGNTRRRVRSREDNNNRGFRNAPGMPIINSSYPPVPRGGEPYIPQNPRFPGVEYNEDRRSSNNRPERFNRPIKPEIERPEVISVEMTPEEQEMYALMGISPLVRLERDVTNPKSVIVSVNSPGERLETNNIITPMADFAEDDNDSDDDFSQGEIESNDLELDDDIQSDFAATVLVSNEQDFNAQSTDSDDNYTSAIFSLTEDSYPDVDSDLDSDLDSEDLEDNSENAKSRRRRRRSSATFELD